MTKFGSLLVTLIGVGWFCSAAFGATSPDIDQAGKLISEGDHAVAVERLSDIIREEQVSPQDMAEAYFLRGTAQQQLGLLGHSVADFTKAIWLMGEESENLADAHFHRGQVYSALRQLKRAIGDFDRALELRSNFAQAYAARGDAYRDRGVHRLAIDDYGASIRFLNPDLHLPFYGRGLTYETMGRTQQAMADFRRAYELAPDFMPAREKLFDQTPTGSIEGPDTLLADAETQANASVDAEGTGEPTKLADGVEPPTDAGSELKQTDASDVASDTTPELRPTLVELPSEEVPSSNDVAATESAPDTNPSVASSETENTSTETGSPSVNETSASIIAPDKVLASDGTQTAEQPQGTSAAVADSEEAASEQNVSTSSAETSAPSPADVPTTDDAATTANAESTEQPDLAGQTPNVSEEPASSTPTAPVADVADSSAGGPVIQTPNAQLGTADASAPTGGADEGTSGSDEGAAVASAATVPTEGETVEVETASDNTEASSSPAEMVDPTSGASTTTESMEVAVSQPAAPPQSATVPVRKTGFFVQIASYRDEGEASLAFDRIAARHSEVLSGAGSDIARADLGAKGVYYRLRVGPYDSIGSSSTVCSQLKARNQDCLVIEEK